MPFINQNFYKKIDNHIESRYNRERHFGEVAQLARARGSYPRCRRFKSVLRYYPLGVVFKSSLFYLKIIQMRQISRRTGSAYAISRQQPTGAYLHK